MAAPSAAAKFSAAEQQVDWCDCMCRYFGPCSDDLQSFSDMSTNAKKRWSKSCQVFYDSCIVVDGRDAVVILDVVAGIFPVQE